MFYSDFAIKNMPSQKKIDHVMNDKQALIEWLLCSFHKIELFHVAIYTQIWENHFRYLMMSANGANIVCS